MNAPLPRQKKQLPNTSYVTVCEAVCWLALGDALTPAAITVSEQAETKAPERELSEDEMADIQSTARELLEACAANRLTLIGRAVTPDGLGDPEKIPPHFFTAAVAIDFVSNSIVPDASAEFSTFERNVNNLTRWEDVKAPTDAIRELSGGQRDGLTKLQRQINAIENAAKCSFTDPLAIPNGGKGTIEEICGRDRRLFSENSFKKAWLAAVKQGRVRMRNHDQFSHS
jgi:hypothetical protein